MYATSSRDVVPSIASHIHHLVLYVWVIHDGRVDDLFGLRDVISNLILFMTTVDERTQPEADSVDRLLVEAVVGTVGLDFFLTRTLGAAPFSSLLSTIAEMMMFMI